MTPRLYAFAIQAAEAQSDPTVGPRLALIGAVVTASVAAFVTIFVAWRNNANQRSLAFSAKAAEADRMRAESAATMAESALQSNTRLIASLQADNDRLRMAVGNCEGTCDEVRDELHRAENRVGELERKAADDARRIAALERSAERKNQRISELEQHVARLEGQAP